MPAQPAPNDYNTMVTHLTFKDAKKAMELYKKAFGAEQTSLMPDPTGNGVMHGELRIGDTRLFFADDMQRGGKTVEAGYAAACVPHLAVPDADAAFKRALDAGCKEVMPLADQFWGDRYGQVVDPFGLVWAILSHVEDVSPEEMAKRAREQFGGG